jgi:hypothetical protein
MSAADTICVLAVSWFTTLLAACSFIDNFTPRQYSLNIHSQDALDQETLLNVIRASRFQPLNFIGISQLTGGQNEDFRIGLPTITFGPGQSAEAREFIFTGNFIDSSASSGFTMNPLISTNFQRAMLTPVSQNTLADLTASYPREAAFYMVIARVKLTRAKAVSVFNNDPGNDRSYTAQVGKIIACSDIFAERVAGGEPNPHQRLAEITSELYFPENDRYCSFSKFVAIMRVALSYGLTATRVTPASPPENTGSTAPSSGGQGGPLGRLCFEEGLADLAKRAVVLGMYNRCDNPNPPQNFAFPFPGANLEFEINLRSPINVFGYIGSLIRNDKTHDIRYIRPEFTELSSEPFVNILRGRYSGCTVDITYLGEEYCIPSEASLNTGIVFQILQALRNLSISPTDLNTPFSVRVVQ